MRLPRYAWAPIALVALLLGCDPTVPPLPGTPDAGTGNLPPSSHLTHNDLHHNSLRADALTANADLRATLARSPLNDEILKETFQMLEGSGMAPDVELTKDEILERTKELIAYVVSCALPPDAEVKIDGATWKGELGLCSAWASRPPPDNACLERVSACVISRVNARDRKVIISMRSEAMRGDLRAPVPVETELREAGGTAIRSFHACDADVTAPDCGFQPLSVGRCNANEQVTVCTGGSQNPMTGLPTCDCNDPISKAEKNVSLRVCKGLYGCDSVPFPDAPAYAGQLEGATNTCQTGRPAVTFTCPTNGPLINPSDDPRTGRRYGYYSVMIASAGGEANDKLADVGLHVGATVATYPATEADVFTYREGAFYGNLFSSTQLKAELRMLSGDAHACFGEAWSDGLATLTDRFCAGTADCFHQKPMPCFRAMDARCESDSGMPGGFYQRCNGLAGPPVWPAPITVYLNHPCDLVDPEACNIGKVPGVPPQ